MVMGDRHMVDELAAPGVGATLFARTDVPLSRPLPGRWERDQGVRSSSPGPPLYPSAAQDDHHPPGIFDTADLIVQARIYEPAELHPGRLLRLASIEHPTAKAPAWAEAYLVCR